MSTAFSRTLHLIHADRGRRSMLGVLGAGLLLGGWVAWATLATLTLYEITGTARLEVDRAVYPIQCPLTGRVTRMLLAVGQNVKAGDVLVELDTSVEQLQVSEEQARLAGMPLQIESLRRQITAELAARGEEQRAAEVTADESRINASQAEVPAAYNAAEVERLGRLRTEKLISERDYQRGVADARQSRLTADREHVAVRRVEQEQRTRASDRASRVHVLESEIVKLEVQMGTSRATAQRLVNEIERRVIRAPIAGRLGEAAPLRVGGVVREGEKIGGIIPGGSLIVVAQYAPSAALGRIAAGRPAQLRLDGFPWAQYGVVLATVSHVASEVRDGTVRVELAVDRAQPARIPLQHGLPGSVEIAVERVSPAALILRTAGKMVSAPRGAKLAGL